MNDTSSFVFFDYFANILGLTAQTPGNFFPEQDYYVMGGHNELPDRPKYHNDTFDSLKQSRSLSIVLIFTSSILHLALFSFQ